MSTKLNPETIEREKPKKKALIGNILETLNTVLEIMWYFEFIFLHKYTKQICLYKQKHRKQKQCHFHINAKQSMITTLNLAFE